MNKQKSKYFSTAVLMDEALIYLLDKKEIEFITVKEICEKAGVNRSTFYLHYETIEDLIEETMEFVIKKFTAYFNENTEDFVNKIKNSELEDLKLVKKEYLTPYLNFVKENKKIFQAAFNNPKGMKTFEQYNDLQKYILIPILEKFNIPQNEQKYWITFHIHGIMAIIEEWLKDNCNDAVESVENIIIKCVKG